MKRRPHPVITGSRLAALFACLSIGLPGLANAAACSVDGDGDVDRDDIRQIVISRNKPASGPGDPRDADGDGQITMADTRICIRRCNLPNCKIIGPSAPAPADNASRSNAGQGTRSQDATGSAQNPGTVVRGKAWRVKKGDTLYSIARAIFPNDSRRQAQLRTDIVKLNPAVFANGANNMSVGGLLKLPGYVMPDSDIAIKPPPAPETKPKSVEVIPPPAPVVRPEAQKPAATPPVTTKVAPVQQADNARQQQGDSRKQKATSRSPAEGGVVASAGFSYGGDEVVEVDGGLDFLAGGGAHLRLGYESRPNRRHGYRILLGTQYNFTLFGGSENASLSDTYLLLAYQYRVDDLVAGIGVVAQSGPEVDNDVDGTTNYDAANGLVIFLENAGNAEWSGLGISYTSIEIEEENTGEAADASRLEVYYSWRF